MLLVLKKQQTNKKTILETLEKKNLKIKVIKHENWFKTHGDVCIQKNFISDTFFNLEEKTHSFKHQNWETKAIERQRVEFFVARNFDFALFSSVRAEMESFFILLLLFLFRITTKMVANAPTSKNKQKEGRKNFF
jgi:hypothetical protein